MEMTFAHIKVEEFNQLEINLRCQVAMLSEFFHLYEGILIWFFYARCRWCNDLSSCRYRPDCCNCYICLSCLLTRFARRLGPRGGALDRTTDALRRILSHTSIGSKSNEISRCVAPFLTSWQRF